VPNPTVVYDKSLKTAGHYSPEGMFHAFLSSMVPSLFHPGGTITINPDNTANVNTTIQHERVHALLNSINSNGTLDQLNNQNPFYKQVAAKIMTEPGGDVSQEAPAYAATGETGQMGIPPVLTKQYNDYLKNQLFKLDPNLASAYQKLSGQ
jgi:hypothetical protein